MLALTAPLCLAAGLWLTSLPANACETALVLAIDVSNSVDTSEYRLQIDGMADAFEDPEIVEVAVQGQVALMVIQWSGADRQEVSIPWTRILSAADLADFAARARGLERAFVGSGTAPGNALRFALDQFGAVPDCTRRVIDVSGDGTPNEGTDAAAVRSAAQRAGITINGIAIESLGRAITGFYERAVITTDGFVITANGHRDYPAAIRAKILRELARVLG